MGFINSNLLKQHLRSILVETGSGDGGGIILAKEAGFKVVHSIELSNEYYEITRKRTAHLKGVHLWQGDSALCLKNIIRGIDEPITFWLDAHFSSPGTATGIHYDYVDQAVAELEQIAQHPIKTHHILIDDIGHSEKLNAAILAVNPEYAISIVEGKGSKIVVATLNAVNSKQ